MNTLNAALERCHLLIEDLAEKADRHFGAIGDPFFEGVRFYVCDQVDGRLNHDQMTELGADRVDEIEGLLMEAGGPASLFVPVLKKLKAVAPALNKSGRCVFLGSWGMGPAELGWCVRYLNDRPTFERYLGDANVTEAAVDLFNAAYAEGLIL